MLGGHGVQERGQVGGLHAGVEEALELGAPGTSISAQKHLTQGLCRLQKAAGALQAGEKKPGLLGIDQIAGDALAQKAAQDVKVLMPADCN